MKTPNYDRLERLASFLDIIRHDCFDFARVQNACGTVGCAMGWAPTVFPDLVEIHNMNGATEFTVKGGHERLSYGMAAAELFDLGKDEATRLFSPNQTRPWADGPLPNSASPTEVATSIRAFIKWRRNTTLRAGVYHVERGDRTEVVIVHGNYEEGWGFRYLYERSDPTRGWDAPEPGFEGTIQGYIETEGWVYKGTLHEVLMAR